MDLDLHKYRWTVVNSSGGKDSQTALRYIVALADHQGYSRSQIVVSHQCLGHLEWKGTLELVKAQAAHYGLRVEITRQRTLAGVNLTILDRARARKKWPDSARRWCTSDFKRGPGHRVITALFREAAGDIVQIFGFRAEESAARAKRPVLELEDALCTKKRTVLNWLPIHNWTQTQVWADIKASGVPYHNAYDLGMPRLSCCFCIFAPRDALLIAGKANPELLEEYVKTEVFIGHDFQHGKPIAEIQAALAAGEQPKASCNGNWDM